MVPVAEFNTVIALNHNGPEWKKVNGEKRSKSRFLHQWIQEAAIPAHLALAFDQNFCLDFVGEEEKGRGHPRKHPYLVGGRGCCAAKKDGCETQFIAGFTEESLRKLMKEDSDTLQDETIELSVAVTGSCVHVKGKTYDWKRKHEKRKHVEMPEENLNQQAEAEEDIPTPTLCNLVARLEDRSENPLSERIIEDDETGLLSIAYSAIGTLTAMVPVADFNTVIALSSNGPEWRKVDEKRSKSRFLRKWIGEVIPAHLVLAFDQNFCLDFPVEAEKGRGRPRKHPYLVGGRGCCAAKKDGCETQFIVGFTEASLRKLMKEDSSTLHGETIEFSVTVTGSCVHVKGKTYDWKRKHVEMPQDVLTQRAQEEEDIPTSLCNFVPRSEDRSENPFFDVEISQDYLTQQAQGEEDIPTSLCNLVARLEDRSENPLSERIIEDDKTGLLSIAYSAIGTLTVMVPVAEFNTVIALNTHGPEWRKVDEKRSKSRFLRKWIGEAIPAHLVLAFDQNFCLDFVGEGEKGRGRPRKHPYLVGGRGCCAAKKDGCETHFIVGFTEASLRKLMKEDSDTLHGETIELSVTVTGSCVHVKGKSYGVLRGIQLDQTQKQRSERKRMLVEMPQDALTQQAEEVEDKSWSRAGSSSEVETSLHNELMSISSKLGLTNNTQAHIRISECFSDTDNIAVMSLATFNNFMNQRSKSRNGLKPKFRKGLQAFVSKHKALSVAFATAAVRDPEDCESKCDGSQPSLSKLV